MSMHNIKTMTKGSWAARVIAVNAMACSSTVEDAADMYAGICRGVSSEDNTLTERYFRIKHSAELALFLCGFKDAMRPTMNWAESLGLGSFCLGCNVALASFDEVFDSGEPTREEPVWNDGDTDIHDFGEIIECPGCHHLYKLPTQAESLAEYRNPP